MIMYLRGMVPVSRYNISDGVFAYAPIMKRITALSINSSSSKCFSCMECQASLLKSTPLTNIASLNIRPIWSLLLPKGMSVSRALISDKYEYAVRLYYV